MKKISCKINDNLTLELRNVKEVYGHDDSLPFNADIYLYLNGKTRATYAGCAYNDGWGGMSIIHCHVQALRPVLQGLADDLQKMEYKYDYYKEVTYLPASLDFLIDLMVEECLYRGKTEYFYKEYFTPKAA